MDMLEEIFRLQREFANMMSNDRYPADQESRVSALCTAIIHEAVELQRLTNFKWWKKPSQFDLEKAKEELIDILHFVIQAAIELGLEPENVLLAYKEKNAINRKRQREGY